MDQILSTEQKDLFKSLVANPRRVDAGHETQLELLVKAYPQSGLLRALLASASQTNEVNVFQQYIKAASVYAPDRGVLYNLINYPEKLVQTGPYKQANVPAIIEDTVDTDAQPGGLNYAGTTEQTPPATPNASGRQTPDIQDLEFELVGHSWGNVSDSKYAHNPEGDESNLEELIFAQYGWINDGTADDKDTTAPGPTIEVENVKQPNSPEGEIKKKA